MLIVSYDLRAKLTPLSWKGSKKPGPNRIKLDQFRCTKFEANSFNRSKHIRVYVGEASN